MPTLRILDSITDRGDPFRANEDSSGGNRHCAFVIDGATGLGENLLQIGDSDAAWLAGFAKNCFEELSTPERPVADIVRTLNERVRAVITETLDGWQPEAWNLPVASFQMIRCGSDGVSTHGLGDCRLFLLGAGGTALDATALTGAREREQEGARRAIAHAGGLAKLKSLTKDPAIRDELRRSRALYNHPLGDVWTLGPEPDAAGHIASERLHPALPARGLLCSDGFAALVDQYARYDAASLVRKAASDGLVALLAELRMIEHREDPDGLAYPRFKVSDDATAVLFEIV
ncbi:hypothetical protein [Aquamicrobium sp. LC103]|uniref:hypothetical protein n=1 Tax=Aquamicrobium sp. LC103 TaxID=1120658 RepID=UPI00063E92D5|nr:hypothetical protein [Aquamicrobium sp. LC103]TKT80095.1 hypothetical protein XW59_007005 [Aquamicrobium sp. LC103]